MIKDRDTLEYIFDLVKKIKKPIVKIYPDGRVIGTDLSFASMNMIVSGDISYNITIPYVFINTELSAFMKYIQGNNKPIEFSQFGFYNHGVSLDNHLEMNFQFDELYEKVAHNTSMPILYHKENVQEITSDMFFLKAADGSKMYNIDQFLMTSFNAIHPANKTDRVDLIVRDLDIYSYFAEFIIYKKKENYELHEFLRFRKL